MAWMSHMAITTITVSRAVQTFTVVASDITELRGHVEQAVQYLATLDNRAFFKNGPANPFIAKPTYTMHKCVGTTALVANVSRPPPPGVSSPTGLRTGSRPANGILLLQLAPREEAEARPRAPSAALPRHLPERVCAFGGDVHAGARRRHSL